MRLVFQGRMEGTRGALKVCMDEERTPQIIVHREGSTRRMYNK